MPAISNRKPYRIGRSRTGLGLFATKPIKKGTEIIEYFGPLLDCRNEDDDAIENKYLFQINGRWTIDGSTRRNVARYINHACRPNAESDVRERKRKVFIKAIKNIAPGEEINYDYGKEYFNEYLKPIGCKCAACEKKRKLERAEARAAKARAKKRAAARAANGAGHGMRNGGKLNGVKLNGRVNGAAANGVAVSRAKPVSKRLARAKSISRPLSKPLSKSAAKSRDVKASQARGRG